MGSGRGRGRTGSHSLQETLLQVYLCGRLLLQSSWCSNEVLLQGNGSSAFGPGRAVLVEKGQTRQEEWGQQRGCEGTDDGLILLEGRRSKKPASLADLRTNYRRLLDPNP